MGTDGVKTAAEFQALLRGEKGECMFNACIFQYVGCDFANNLIG